MRNMSVNDTRDKKPLHLKVQTQTTQAVQTASASATCSDSTNARTAV